jgi:ATP-dependent DNA helicase RecG
VNGGRRKIARHSKKKPVTVAHPAPSETLPANRLLWPIREVKGVGPATAEALERRGIRLVGDLLYLIPLRYEDRRLICTVAEIKEGEENVLLGRVVDSGQLYSRASRKRIYQARIEDATGAITLKWFRFGKAWVTSMCKLGNLLFVAGKASRFGAELQMVHPRVTVMAEGRDVEDVGTIIPVYPEIEGVKQGVLHNVVRSAFIQFRQSIKSLIPTRVAKDHGLPDLAGVLADCHMPERSAYAPDRDILRSRLVLEEFFLFQCALLQQKRETGQGNGLVLTAGSFHGRLRAGLPYRLTPGQERAWGEIEADMASPRPMNRLLQGDVGCGKTICALLAASVALDSGRQVVFMAPTEILAEQLYLGCHRMLDAIGAAPVLLRGGMGPERAAILEGIREGSVRVIVGTHALLQPDVVFHSLGLAIIDEQHRFGVIQRKSLKGKGADPDVLVMSATPIPRTLSMVVYGDLDVSSIDDMPAGRQRVRTLVVKETERQRVHDAVMEETGKGRQVFVVCPVIDESEQPGTLSAKEAFQAWKGLFSDLRLGLLHGKMRPSDKERAMMSFRDGDIDVLVCTTVVEVGIDVPNATLMVVEHAERFGLSQLHQLRGRVGRGAHPSRCVLVGSTEGGTNAAKRLKVLEKTGDGFAIAEEDLKLRGPGDMFGVRQTGIADFRIGNIVRDGHLMEKARKMAGETLASGSQEELARIGAEAMRRWGGKILLGDVL